MDTRTVSMTRIITISDDVYRTLVREKGDRSFSEVIADHLEAGGQLADVAGQGIFDAGTHERVTDDVETPSKGDPRAVRGVRFFETHRRVPAAPSEPRPESCGRPRTRQPPR